MYPLDDTITAIASPPGGAARGIVRLSGPNTLDILRRCVHVDGGGQLSTASPPSAIGGALRLTDIDSHLPCDVYLWPEGRSYTGGPMAEIHTLGSPPLLQAALRTFCEFGARMAEPGEFTLRAFLAGRIDLTQAEAVLGVIDAADPSQLNVALVQLAGGLAEPLHRLRDTLIDILAELEAGLDFADEDLPFIGRDQLIERLSEAIEQVTRLTSRVDSRGEAVESIRVVLTGLPNSGKSSLFNALVRGPGALVSEQPGTTRDYLTAELDLDSVKCQGVECQGVKCQLIDTAGIDSDAATSIDGDVQRAARAAASEQVGRANVTILCLDSSCPPDAQRQAQRQPSVSGQQIVVWTKADLTRSGAIGVPPVQHGKHGQDARGTRQRVDSLPDGMPVSSLTGQGVDELRNAVRRAVLAAGASGGEVVAGTAIRCRESLRLALNSLARALDVVRLDGGEELVAVEVRVALDELGKVVGAVYTEDLLDRIFSRFCIGK
ncbi:MAG: tRNA modification GTPase [Thermoguttaceae bacterium]